MFKRLRYLISYLQKKYTPPAEELYEKLIGAGTHGYEESVRRRLRVLNVVAYLVALVTLIYSIHQIRMGLTAFRPLIFINLSMVFIALLVPVAHRFHEVAGGVMLALAEYWVLYALTSYLGRDSGLQLQYFVGSAASFLILGTGRPALALAIAGGGIVLNLLVWFRFPPETATIQLPVHMLNTLYVNASITTGAVITAAVYYAYAQLEEAHKQVDILLRNSLPDSIVERLKQDREAQISDRFDDVSVLFLDLVGFTPMSEKLGPHGTVKLLDGIMSALDEVARRHGVEKIKTIGDAYMAACGVPVIRKDHDERMARMALEILPMISQVARQNGADMSVRIGIACGPVIGGMIGTARMTYDIWGPTVNLAARMESHGKSGFVQVTNDFKNRLEEKFVFESAGVKQIKGMGRMPVWFLMDTLNDTPHGK